jgi:Transposase IS200 like
MPEHVHLLTNEPATRTLASFLSVIKGESSKLLKGSRERFWQTRYYDFNTFTSGKFVEKVQYIHRNPVTRGLVTKPEDYRWSSFNHYATGEPSPIQIESQWPPQTGAHSSKARTPAQIPPTPPNRDNPTYVGQPASIHSLKSATRSAGHGSSGGIEPLATLS